MGGFRVAATNLPVHHVDAPVAAAAPVPVATVAEPTVFDVAATPSVVAEAPSVVAAASTPVVSAYTNNVITPQVQYAYLPYAQNYGYSTGETGYYGAAAPEAATYYGAAAPVAAYSSVPVAVSPASQPAGQAVQYAQAPVVQATPVIQAAPVIQTAPVVHAAPVAVAAPVVTATADGPQYHAQDPAGQYSFGYNDPNSVRQEVKTADGVVRGAYRYVDTNGIVQTVEYIADAAGFRVAGTNLPVGAVDLPVPVQDTPEVAAAKQAHFQAVGAAAAAAAIQPEVVSYNAAPLPVVEAAPVPVVAPAPAAVTFPEVSGIAPVEAPELAVNTAVPANYAPVSNAASIPAFESLPPVATYSQQIYYGAAAAPATISYAQ